MRKKLMTFILAASLLISGTAISVSDTADAVNGSWKKDSKGWWYSYSDGTYARSQWLQSGGKWYHFDDAGYMQTGWKKISGKWYYFASSGTMQTGWKLISGKWYFFASSGAMQTGWKLISGKWYFLASSGIMQTGWKKISGKWYFFDPSGVMQTGTVKIGEKYYTFNSDGVWIEDISKEPSLSEAQVGDYVSFGHYEQDNVLSNGKEPIKWLVLAKENGKLLVISECGLDDKPYHDNYESITWEHCTLRKWLNQDFLNEAFSTVEQTMILSSYIVNDDNPVHGTEGGNNTEDKIFLLSLDEMLKYFNLNNKGTLIYGSGDNICCKATAYAIAHGAYAASWDPKTCFPEEKKYEGCCYWWLRSPGYRPHYAADVGSAGSIQTNGSGVSYQKNAVRPAMWITP